MDFIVIYWHCVNKSNGIRNVDEKFFDGKNNDLRRTDLNFDEFVLGLNDLERDGHLLAFDCFDDELERYERGLVLGNLFEGSLSLGFLYQGLCITNNSI